MKRPGPIPEEEVIELDLGNVILRLLEGFYFLVLNYSLFVGFCFILSKLEDVTFAMDHSLMVTASIVLSSFITGVTIGLKISRQKGGLLALSFALLAFLGFTYMLQHELPMALQISKYVPLMHTAPKDYAPFLVPMAGFLGILAYRLFTVTTD